MPLLRRFIVRSGDLVLIDFGVPIGSSAGFVRPTIVVTAQPTLDGFDQTFQVVPVTSTERTWPSDVPTELGNAQCHLMTTVDQAQIVQHLDESIGPVLLAQVRETLAILLGM
jgi:mRNA-degrading endonuclease toxin of MazEF toxin-antitoxin module